MGNSNSTENNPKNDSDRASNGSGNTKVATASSSVTSATSGYQFEKHSPAPPVVTTAASSSSSHKQRHAVPFRLSVTTVPDNNSDHNSSAPPSATTPSGDTNMELPPSSPNDPSASPITATATATATTSTPTTTTTTATKAVPLSTGKSGWVSSTGNASPWYGGSLSSSTSSHHRSDSVRGPYYRTRGMSINREQEIEEEQFPQQQQQQQQRLSRNRSTVHQSKGVPTIINWSQGGQSVYVTGTFNGWKHKIKLVKSTQDFATVLELPSGTHRLKFIVDDEWKCSNEMETATDPDGNLVNYLQVIDENEDSFDELGGSSASTARDIQSRSSTPTSEYTSEIPPDLLALAKSLSAEENDNRCDQGSTSNSSTIAMEWDQQQPPSLPPHLEKVLLNSQNLSDEDNSVLPEPNHVTLNHLYASSIKDNVMALSTTTRYRKKYVTTMYYRPVVPKQ